MLIESFPHIEPIVVDRVRVELAAEPAALARFERHVGEGGVATMIGDCVDTLSTDPTVNGPETLGRGGDDAEALVGSVVGYVADAFVARCRLGR
jgi:hypothetical protein